MAYDLSTDDYLTDDRLQTTLVVDPSIPWRARWGNIVAKWFCLIDGQQTGPVEAAALKQLASSGRLKPSDKVRREDMGQWHQASAVNGLFVASQSASAGSSAAPASRSGLLAETKPRAERANKDEWYYLQDGQQQGPISVVQLKQLATTGKLKRSDLIWKEGMAEWMAARTVAGLLPAQSAPPPPPRIPALDTQATASDDHNSWLDHTSSQNHKAVPIRVPELRRTAPSGNEMVVGDGPKGFAITGLVLGVCGAVISITPCLWMFGVVPDVLGVIFSGLALRKVKAGVAGGKGMAVAGLVCGIVAIVLWFVMMASMGKSMNEMDQSLERLRHLSQ